MLSAIAFTVSLIKLCLTAVAALFLLFVAWAVRLVYIAPLFDALENLAGPTATRFTSHLAEMMNPNITIDVYAAYRERYGLSWRFHGFGAFDYRLLTLDTRALIYIINSPIFERPVKTRRMLAEMLGVGVASLEGEDHRKIRRLINPAFYPQSIKPLAPTFVYSAEELCSVWEKRFESGEDQIIVDIYHWTARAALDVIGRTGFGWDFSALKHETDDIYNAYRDMLETVEKGPGLKFFLDLQFPWLPKIWSNERNDVIRRSNARIKAWGRKVIDADKRLFASEGGKSSRHNREKTLLRLLIEANSEITEPSARLDDEQLLDQLSTFVFAGSDTLSGGISWTVHLLSQYPDWQERLREEVLPIVALGVNSQVERLDTSPVLDHVVRESLRIGPPVHATIRVATKDDRIPLSQPILKRNGKWEDFIPITKGSYIHIPIEALNTSANIWGPDAHEFKQVYFTNKSLRYLTNGYLSPSRWNNLPRLAQTHPGLAGLMSFSFGPQSCPGYKFAILEIKIFIAVLVSRFNFQPEGNRISRFSSVVTRPNNQTPTKRNPTLPVKISRR